MAIGVRLALDWGQARIGVAACDGLGILAYPVETIAVNGAEWVRISDLVAQYRPIEIVLGLPTDLGGRIGLAATSILEIANRLAEENNLPIRLVDERMTTAEASKQLSGTGKSKKRQRAIIDQAAAVGILRTVLTTDIELGQVIIKEKRV